MKKEHKKVLVGMSGGVDSSTVAALLKERGYEVRGVFMIMHDAQEKIEKDIRDIEKVSQILGIECEILDLRERFKKEVVKYFLDEYAAGRTPNPCVFCNENFKFKILLEEADKNKADYVATGHYARRSREIPNSKFQIPNKSKIKNSKSKTIYKLKTAKDKNKDQSYFLYRLGQKELARIIFPLGEYEKNEVRKLAEEFGLPVSEKKESQDVCFLAGLTTEIFLKNNLKLKKGKILDTSGNVLGEHQGLPLYTLGQRRGINIGGTGPYYVVSKDFQKNSLIVTNDKEEASLFLRGINLKDVKWTSGKPNLPVRVLAETRYHESPSYVTIEQADSGIAAVFERPHQKVASGQSVVFYTENGEVIGGGTVN